MRGIPLWLGNVVATLRGRRPPIALCYHGIGSVSPADDPSGLHVPSYMFESHLDALIEAGYELVGVSELWRRLGVGAGEGVAAITFDDVPDSVVENALPLLADRGANATLFAATGLLGQRHPDLRDGKVISRAQLADAAAAGFEIGAHTVDHLDLTKLTATELDRQLRHSKADLEELLGSPVEAMAYPFGLVDDRVEDAARAAGYLLACGCSGPGPRVSHRFPREPVFASTTVRRLRLKAAGLYGPVHVLAGLRASLRSARHGRAEPADEGPWEQGETSPVELAPISVRFSDRVMAALWRLPLPKRILVRIGDFVLRQPPIPLYRFQQIMAALESVGVNAFCAGGWGIDALIGRQTRVHGDLDLVVDASEAERAEGALREIGYREWYRWTAPAGIWYRDPSSDGETEEVVVMRDRAMYVVDIHPVDLKRSGITREEGSIEGVPVLCMSLESQQRVHDRYHKALGHEHKDAECARRIRESREANH